METTTLWWITTGLFVAAEMLTGTFYMLMIALGLSVGALSAHLGATLTVQMTVAAVFGAGAVATWYLILRTQSTDAQASLNRDIHLDIGETVHVDAWSEDGTAQVRYRGSNWTAVLSPNIQTPNQAQKASATQAIRGFQIVEVQGSRLIVKENVR